MNLPRVSPGGKGTPLPGWSDTGGDSWEGDQTEAYSMFLAFASIIENDITVCHMVQLTAACMLLVAVC